MCRFELLEYLGKTETLLTITNILLNRFTSSEVAKRYSLNVLIENNRGRIMTANFVVVEQDNELMPVRYLDPALYYSVSVLEETQDRVPTISKDLPHISKGVLKEQLENITGDLVKAHVSPEQINSIDVTSYNLKPTEDKIKIDLRRRR